MNDLPVSAAFFTILRKDRDGFQEWEKSSYTPCKKLVWTEMLWSQNLNEHLLVTRSDSDVCFHWVCQFSGALVFGIDGKIGTLWWLLNFTFLRIKYNNFHSSRWLGRASCLPLWAFNNLSLGSVWWIGCIYSLLGVCYVNMTHSGALRIHGLG